MGQAPRDSHPARFEVIPPLAAEDADRAAAVEKALAFLRLRYRLSGLYEVRATREGKTWWVHVTPYTVDQPTGLRVKVAGGFYAVSVDDAGNVRQHPTA